MDSIRTPTVDNVVLERFVPPTSADDTPRKQRLVGQLHLVRHHLFFAPRSSSSATTEEIWIPYPTIARLTRLSQSVDGLWPLLLRTKTFESYLLLFEKEKEGGAEDVWKSVKDCAVLSNLEQLYAFYYSLPRPPSSQAARDAALAQNTSNPISPLSSSPELPQHVSPSSTKSASGWDAYNARTEFSRQGVGIRTKAWRFTDINKDYSFSPTYPGKLVVPSRISDSVLAYAGKYRSKARIPTLTYLHWANQASITRSSQPMVGLKISRSAQDEKLVECIFTTHLSADSAYIQSSEPLAPIAISPATPQVYGATATNLIIDARPTTNAMANVAMGAGTENMDNYKTGKKAYLGIDNIHVMRNSLRTIDEAIQEAEQAGGSVDKMALRKSNWIRHISTILDGALIVIRNIHLNASHVLVHCSDGWDRTAQLCAVAEICLDPYYRTIDGFRILIEKDWLSFGHKFLDRCGHLSSEKFFSIAEAPDEGDDDDFGGAQKAAQAFFASMQKQFTSTSHLKEISPVFHQFLDCVWQLWRQFPARFEFNEQYLLDLHRQLYTCQLGTFLFNNEQQRRTPQSTTSSESKLSTYVDRTVSAWDFFDLKRSEYLSEAYDAKLDDRESRVPNADQGVLLLDPKDVKFWFNVFGRGDEEMNASKVPLQQAQGGELLGPVGADQVDPASIEGVVGSLDPGSSLSAPQPAQRRSPSPSLAKLSDSNKPVSNDTGPTPTDAGIASKDAETSRSPPRGQPRTMGGGWNWSQLSSGALSAIQRGAKEMRTIGQEAVSQIRAESGQLDGEMWTRTNPDSKEYAPGTGIGEGRVEPGWNAGARGPAAPPPALRLPSESNPWMPGPTGTSPAISSGDGPVAGKSTGVNPAKGREMSLSTNPWSDAQSLRSLDNLTLQDDPPRKTTGDVSGQSSSTTNGSIDVTPNTIIDVDGAAGTKSSKTLSEPQDQSKSWDPLGAL